MDIEQVVTLALSISDPKITMENFVGALCILNPGDTFKEDLGLWFVRHARPHFLTDLLTTTPDKIGKTPVMEYLGVPVGTSVITVPVNTHLSFTMSKGGQA